MTCRCQDFLTEPLGFLSNSLTSPDGGADTKELQSGVVVPEAVVTASHNQPKTQGVLLFFLNILIVFIGS